MSKRANTSLNAAGPDGDAQHRYYAWPAVLQFRSPDAAGDRWLGRTAAEWSVDAGLLAPFSAPDIQAAAD